MKVIDCHAHPPRKGYPAIDPRPYIFPQSDEDRDVLLEREARELLANMDNYQVDQKIMLAFPPDMEHEFHYGNSMQKLALPVILHISGFPVLSNGIQADLPASPV